MYITKIGEIDMKEVKKVYGKGIKDADYLIRTKKEIDGGLVDWSCPYYDRWKGMLVRCYSENSLKKHPTYEGCTVCDEWLYFSNFRKWMVDQDWEGKQLDKDILFEGNKIYSPDTCVFVPKNVNLFVITRNKSRGDCMLGVSYDKKRKRFEARCSNPFTKKNEKLGRFKTELEAHQAWLKRKQELCIELCKTIDDQRIVEALYRRYGIPYTNE